VFKKQVDNMGGSGRDLFEDKPWEMVEATRLLTYFLEVLG
jgi:hypothetical protein